MKRMLSTMRKGSLIFLLAFVALLSACGTGGSNDPQTISGDNNNGGLQQGSTPTPTTTTSTNNNNSNTTGDNSSFVYGSVKITILSIDQKKEYADDSNYNEGLLLRINVKEQNISKSSSYLHYSDMRLILPDGTSIASTRNGGSAYIDNDVTRNNWVDFPVSTKQDVEKLVWRVGQPTEYQMDIPLSKNRDLSKYQDRVSTPNTNVKWGIDWTITKITSSLSYEGVQAGTGKRYVILSFKGENKSGNTFYAYPNEKFRLKSNTVSEAPKSSSIPSYIDANFKGDLGQVQFEMPANENNFTLNLLQNDTAPATSVNFQI